MDVKPEGVGPAVATPPDKSEGPPHPVGAAASLTAMAADWVLFTPALLYTHAGLDLDPVQQWVNDQPDTPEVALMRFDRPLFQGLTLAGGNKDWNHQILAARQDRWPSLAQALGTVGLADSRRGLFYRVVPRIIPVADRVLMARRPAADRVPAVEVVVACLAGNKRSVELHAFDDPLRLPAVRITGPDPEAAAFFAALQAGQNPYTRKPV